MNKRGDIPITILVIGVFAVCVLSIFGFMISANKMNGKLVGPGMIESVLATEEEFKFKQEIGVENQLIFEKENSLIEIEDRIIKGIFYEESFFGKEKKVLFSVRYNFVD
jgi:hypothetical protein